MCGAYDSILGRDTKETISKFLTDEKTRYTVAEGEATFCAVIVTFDNDTLRASNIERIYLHP